MFEVRPNNSPVIGETILGAYNLRIRVWQRWPVVAAVVETWPDLKGRNKRSWPCRTSDVLGVHCFDTDGTYLVDSAVLRSVVVARVSLNRIGQGAECVVMGARNLSD